MIRLLSRIQALPVAEAAKLHTTHGKEFEAVLAPLFSWGLAN
jgi:hypothetical protein